MGHRVDRVPAGLGDKAVDREFTALGERANREPAAAVIRREEGPHEPLLLLDAAADRSRIDGQARRRGLGDCIRHEPLLQGQLVDARHRSDPAEHRADRERGQESIDAAPESAPRFTPGQTAVLSAGKQTPAADPRRDSHEVVEAGKEPQHAILGLTAGARTMVHGSFHDAEARRGREHRNKTVHAGVERNPLGDGRAKDLEPAVVVVQVEPGEQAHQAVEYLRRQRLVPGIEPRHLPAVDEVDRPPRRGRGIDQREHARNLSGIVLAVAVEHGDLRRAAAGETGRERRRLAKRPLLTDALHPRIGGPRGDDLRPRRVRGAVVDHGQFPSDAGPAEHRANLVDERADVARLVADGNDDRHVGGVHAGPVCLA